MVMPFPVNSNRFVLTVSWQGNVRFETVLKEIAFSYDAWNYSSVCDTEYKMNFSLYI